MKRTADEKFDYKRNKERKANQFFIDPSGKIHRYKGDMYVQVISMHYEIAYGLYPNIDRAEDYIMNQGWIMVGSSVYNCPIVHKKPTQAQINVLYDLGLYSRLCFLHDNSYPNYEKYGILCE